MIEILLGTFNGGAFLEQQINSILEQTFTDWKIIIRDDGSTDNTIRLIEGAYYKLIESCLVPKNHLDRRT